MATWLVPRIGLTPEQLRAVELPPTEHRVVMGLPGSGKTQVLLHRAAYLRERFQVPPERFRIFTFNNVLRDYLRSSLDLLDLPMECLSVFDAWCAKVYRGNVARSLPKLRGKPGVDFPRVRADVLKVVTSQRPARNWFDFVLVDEGQDLTPECFTILHHAARHVTVFVDHLQQVYEGGAGEATILQKLGIPQRNLALLGAYRNSPEVARLAACFIGDPQRRQQYLSQTADNHAERERPLLFVATTLDEEMERLATIVRQRQIQNQSVAVVVPVNRQIFGLAKGLAQRGVPVDEVAAPKGGGARRAPPDFTAATPKILNYHNAKGLTFDCVLMPRLTGKPFQPFSPETREHLLFVGIARATKWVYLSTVEGHGIRELGLLRDAEAAGHLTIQRGTASGQLGIDGSPGSEEDAEVEEEDYSVL